MCPDVLYEKVVEVEERVVLVQDKCQLDWDGKAVEEGVTGEKVLLNLQCKDATF